jgi:hypothetical protein
MKMLLLATVAVAMTTMAHAQYAAHVESWATPYLAPEASQDRCLFYAECPTKDFDWDSVPLPGQPSNLPFVQQPLPRPRPELSTVAQHQHRSKAKGKKGQ